ncbi:SO_0444 family Cu/Zn efflux transporter [Shewanella sp. 1_MG-2023]|uniref:SO_0444 family Cu/Zn efflux transporter n=1 Tax=unclassified Shewanella TaxID=196818 RepID=UPI000C81E038|nr:MULTISPECIES: SO_0444 family Cu/Zn efflux transporter [unclassified Shewanella]MDO6612629.1 SO_0444 family Cu/Zn efflux transporter [Shewanella sp. 7_MG-2023]MDO6772328.1 SO_0444 family Cu/Zn efflux transporter [Shewanella sp. 2_MG-2023]MDO6795311.1 SO_0444 family Cu/Zn efflux transporter [Shewanella sp. 1_MG-2023]PMG80021.1 permease [Shewanella sp. 10N.286.51.B7]
MLLSNFIELFLESAPWLLLGLVLAGLLKVFVPMAWMQKQLGGHGLKTVVKAAVIGAPLPLCSCGVIPAAVGLRRSGASKAATTSFLVSTPETGVDSVTVSYVLLGPFMAIIRPIAAITSAVVAGLLVGRDDKPEIVETKLDKGEKLARELGDKGEVTSSCCSKNKASAAPKFTPDTAPMMASTTETKSCCSSKAVQPEKTSCCSSKVDKAEVKSDKASCCASKADKANLMAEETSCCSSKPDLAAESSESCCESTKDMATELKNESILSRVKSGLVYAATDLVRDTTLWLLVGLFFAALVQTFVPGDFLAKWGDGILAMLVMVLISVPMYICATASTPIAAGLLLAGVSPGAVLVFMMAGPATNIATLGVVTKELGKRALFGYLGGVLGVALAFGVLVNYLVAEFGFVVMPQIGHEHELLPSYVTMGSGIVLALLMAKVIYDKLPKKSMRRDCCS